uniref:Uncharacterized protein n=1 Tax=Ficedula albicollis TaxID=59894 RepID=A0A803WC11_FICAL
RVWRGRIAVTPAAEELLTFTMTRPVFSYLFIFFFFPSPSGFSYSLPALPYAETPGVRGTPGTFGTFGTCGIPGAHGIPGTFGIPLLWFPSPCSVEEKLLGRPWIAE